MKENNKTKHSTRIKKYFFILSAIRKRLKSIETLNREWKGIRHRTLRMHITFAAT